MDYTNDEMDEQETTNIKNDLMVALEPFQTRKFITLTKTFAGWELTIFKNCMHSNSIFGYIRNNCCKTVTGFIKEFNSAITRVYRAHQIPNETALSVFFGFLHVSIDPNFLNVCINKNDETRDAFIMNEVALFLNLINLKQGQFEALQRVSKREYDSIAGLVQDHTSDGGRHKRHYKHSSRRSYTRRKTHKKQHNRRSLQRKHSNRHK